MYIFMPASSFKESPWSPEVGLYGSYWGEILIKNQIILLNLFLVLLILNMVGVFVISIMAWVFQLFSTAVEVFALYLRNEYIMNLRIIFY